MAQLVISLFKGGQNNIPYILKEEEVSNLISPDLTKRELKEIDNSPNLNKDNLINLRFQKKVSRFVNDNNYIFHYEDILLLVEKNTSAYLKNKIVDEFKKLFSLEVEVKYIQYKSRKRLFLFSIFQKAQKSQHLIH